MLISGNMPKYVSKSKQKFCVKTKKSAENIKKTKIKGVKLRRKGPTLHMILGSREGVVTGACKGKSIILIITRT